MVTQYWPCDRKLSGMLEVILPYTPYLALFLRVIVGASLMVHGRPKFSNIEQIKKYAQGMGAPASAAYAVAILEFLGGLFLILGITVPIVALFLLIQFAAITVAKKFKLKGAYISGQSPVKYEMDVLYLLFASTLIVLGAGALSIDSLVGL